MNNYSKKHSVILLIFLLLLISKNAYCESSAYRLDSDFAKGLINPLARITTITLQDDYAPNYGVGDKGNAQLYRIYSTIPIDHLIKYFDIIIRTQIPLLSQTEIYPDSGSQFGLSNATFAFYFAPKKSLADGWFGGAGPIVSPPASNILLGSRKWSSGVAMSIHRTDEHVTFGILTHQLWSNQGSDNLHDTNQLYVRPYVSYTTENAITYYLDSETTYYWAWNTTTIPITFLLGKLVHIGKERVNFYVGPTYFAQHPTTGPNSWGMRAGVNFIFNSE